MPKTYKGKVEIRCLKEFCKDHKDVLAACLDCEFSEAIVVDLEDKPVGTIKKTKKAGQKERR